MLITIFLATLFGPSLFLTASEAHLDYFPSHELDISSHLWTNSFNLENNTFSSTGSLFGCDYCGEIFYHEPPPSDILFIPPPPPHPNYQGSLESISRVKYTNDQCNFCEVFYNENEQLLGGDGSNQDSNHRIIALLAAFLSISGALFIYIITTRRSKIMASLTWASFFDHSNGHSTATSGHPMDKNNPTNESLNNSGGVHDPCYIQTNRDKNLTSPIISDHVPHKKTSIPSKYWDQPGSVIGRTIRRIPNEYEVPSSRTNSTGTSSAVYADMINGDQANNNQRFFSPYNLHTYAEVREVLDPNDNVHTSSNSSVMMSESNYDNAVYNHGSCLMSNGGVINIAPNGSVQMSDFNSMRPIQNMTTTYGQTAAPINHHHHINQPKIMQHNSGMPVYEQPPKRAQIIITSNNQGVNPALLNFKERVHDVI